MGKPMRDIKAEGRKALAEIHRLRLWTEALAARLPPGERERVRAAIEAGDTPEEARFK